ncbi:MAG: fructose-bisphosphatase class II [Endomicrobiales bacterium]|nr:fructose-bisphosphatase class II [Endomicrobiales bacterium]
MGIAFVDAEREVISDSDIMLTESFPGGIDPVLIGVAGIERQIVTDKDGREYSGMPLSDDPAVNRRVEEITNEHLADKLHFYGMAALRARTLAARNTGVLKGLADKEAEYLLGALHDSLPYVTEMKAAEGARDDVAVTTSKYGFLGRLGRIICDIACDPIEVTNRLSQKIYLACVTIGSYALYDMYRLFGRPPPTLHLPDQVYMLKVFGPLGSGVRVQVPFFRNFVKWNMQRVARARGYDDIAKVRITGMLLRERHINMINSAFRYLEITKDQLERAVTDLGIDTDIIDECFIIKRGYVQIKDKSTLKKFKGKVQEKGGKLIIRNDKGGFINLLIDGDLMPVNEIIDGTADMMIGAGAAPESMVAARMSYHYLDYCGVPISSDKTRDGNVKAVQADSLRARILTKREVEICNKVNLKLGLFRGFWSILDKDDLAGGPYNLAIVASPLGNPNPNHATGEENVNDFLPSLGQIEVSDDGKQVKIPYYVVTPTGKREIINVTYNTRLNDPSLDDAEKGEVYLGLKMFKEAKACFERANLLHWLEYVQALEHITTATDVDVEKAKGHLKAALEANPGFEPAHVLLLALEKDKTVLQEPFRPIQKLLRTLADAETSKDREEAVQGLIEFLRSDECTKYDEVLILRAINNAYNQDLATKQDLMVWFSENQDLKETESDTPKQDISTQVWDGLKNSGIGQVVLNNPVLFIVASIGISLAGVGLIALGAVFAGVIGYSLAAAGAIALIVGILGGVIWQDVRGRMPEEIEIVKEAEKRQKALFDAKPKDKVSRIVSEKMSPEDILASIPEDEITDARLRTYRDKIAEMIGDYNAKGDKASPSLIKELTDLGNEMYLLKANDAIEKSQQNVFFMIMLAKSVFAENIAVNNYNEETAQMFKAIQAKAFKNIEDYITLQVDKGNIKADKQKDMYDKAVKHLSEWLNEPRVPLHIKQGIIRGMLEGRSDDLIYVAAGWREFGTAGIRNQGPNSDIPSVLLLELEEFAQNKHAPILMGPNTINLVVLLQQTATVKHMITALQRYIDANPDAIEVKLADLLAISDLSERAKQVPDVVIQLPAKFKEDLKNNQVVFAYDSRLQGDFFAKALAADLLSAGIKVQLFDNVAGMPGLDYASYALNNIFGFLISASHSEPNFNGFKFTVGYRASQVDKSFQQMIMAFRNLLDYGDISLNLAQPDADIEAILQKNADKLTWLGYQDGEGEYGAKSINFYKQYNGHVAKRSPIRRMINQKPWYLRPFLRFKYAALRAKKSILYNAFSGAGCVDAGNFPGFMRNMGYKLINLVKVQTEHVDGRFPAFIKEWELGMPDPGNVEAFTTGLLDYLVQEGGENLEGIEEAISKLNMNDLVVATDPDIDRAAMAFNMPEYAKGNVISRLVPLVRTYLQENTNLSEDKIQTVIEYIEKNMHDKLHMTANDSWMLMSYNKLKMLENEGLLRKDKVYLMIKSHVTTDGMHDIAKYYQRMGYHVHCVDTYVGFTLLAERADQLFNFSKNAWAAKMLLESGDDRVNVQEILSVMEDAYAPIEEQANNLPIFAEAMGMLRDAAKQGKQVGQVDKALMEKLKEQLTLVSNIDILCGVEESNGYGEFGATRTKQAKSDDVEAIVDKYTKGEGLTQVFASAQATITDELKKALGDEEFKALKVEDRVQEIFSKYPWRTVAKAKGEIILALNKAYGSIVDFEAVFGLTTTKLVTNAIWEDYVSIEDEHIREKDGSLAAYEFSELGVYLDSVGKSLYESYMDMWFDIGTITSTFNSFTRYPGAAGREQKAEAIQAVEKMLGYAAQRDADSGKEVNFKINGREYTLNPEKAVQVYWGDKYDNNFKRFPEEGIRFNLERTYNNVQYNIITHFRPSGTGTENRDYNWSIAVIPKSLYDELNAKMADPKLSRKQKEQARKDAMMQLESIRQDIEQVLQDQIADFFGLEKEEDIPKGNVNGLLLQMQQRGPAQFEKVFAEALGKKDLGLSNVERKLYDMAQKYAYASRKLKGKIEDKERKAYEDAVTEKREQNRALWRTGEVQEFLKKYPKKVDVRVNGKVVAQIPKAAAVSWAASAADYVVSLIEESGEKAETISCELNDFAQLIGQSYPDAKILLTATKSEKSGEAESDIGKRGVRKILERLASIKGVTAQAAKSVIDSGLIGKGREFKKQIDKTASDKIKARLDEIGKQNGIKFVIVGGEGAKDKLTDAEMVAKGKVFGDLESTSVVEIIVDPVDGTTLSSLGKNNVTSVIAAAEEGCLLPVLDQNQMFNIVYWGDKKANVNIDLSKDKLEDNTEAILEEIAKANNIRVDELTVLIPESLGHTELRDRVAKTGATVRPCSNADISNRIYAGTNRGYVYMGIGGSVETVSIAAALRHSSRKDGSGAQLQSVFTSKNLVFEGDEAKDEYLAGARDFEHSELDDLRKAKLYSDKQYNLRDLVRTENVMLFVTPITEDDYHGWEVGQEVIFGPTVKKITIFDQIINAINKLLQIRPDVISSRIYSKLNFDRIVDRFLGRMHKSGLLVAQVADLYDGERGGWKALKDREAEGDIPELIAPVFGQKVKKDVRTVYDFMFRHFTKEELASTDPDDVYVLCEHTGIGGQRNTSGMSRRVVKTFPNRETMLYSAFGAPFEQTTERALEELDRRHGDLSWQDRKELLQQRREKFKVFKVASSKSGTTPETMVGFQSQVKESIRLYYMFVYGHNRGLYLANQLIAKMYDGKNLLTSPDTIKGLTNIQKEMLAIVFDRMIIATGEFKEEGREEVGGRARVGGSRFDYFVNKVLNEQLADQFRDLGINGISKTTLVSRFGGRTQFSGPDAIITQAVTLYDGTNSPIEDIIEAVRPVAERYNDTEDTTLLGKRLAAFAIDSGVGSIYLGTPSTLLNDVLDATQQLIGESVDLMGFVNNATGIKAIAHPTTVLAQKSTNRQDDGKRLYILISDQHADKETKRAEKEIIRRERKKGNHVVRFTIKDNSVEEIYRVTYELLGFVEWWGNFTTAEVLGNIEKYPDMVKYLCDKYKLTPKQLVSVDFDDEEKARELIKIAYMPGAAFESQYKSDANYSYYLALRDIAKNANVWYQPGVELGKNYAESYGNGMFKVGEYRVYDPMKGQEVAVPVRDEGQRERFHQEQKAQLDDNGGAVIVDGILHKRVDGKLTDAYVDVSDVQGVAVDESYSLQGIVGIREELKGLRNEQLSLSDKMEDGKYQVADRRRAHDRIERRVEDKQRELYETASKVELDEEGDRTAKQIGRMIAEMHQQGLPVNLPLYAGRQGLEDFGHFVKTLDMFDTVQHASDWQHTDADGAVAGTLGFQLLTYVVENQGEKVMFDGMVPPHFHNLTPQEILWANHQAYVKVLEERGVNFAQLVVDGTSPEAVARMYALFARANEHYIQLVKEPQVSVPIAERKEKPIISVKDRILSGLITMSIGLSIITGIALILKAVGIITLTGVAFYVVLGIFIPTFLVFAALVVSLFGLAYFPAVEALINLFKPKASSSNGLVVTQKEVNAANALVAHFTKRDEIPGNSTLVVLGNPREGYAKQALEVIRTVNPEKIIVAGFGPASKIGDPEYESESSRISRELIALDPSLADKILVDEEDLSTNTGKNVDVVARVLRDHPELRPENIVLTQHFAGARLSQRIFQRQFPERSGLDYVPNFFAYEVGVPKGFALRAGRLLNGITRTILQDFVGQVHRLKNWTNFIVSRPEEDVPAHIQEAATIINGYLSRYKTRRIMFEINHKTLTRLLPDFILNVILRIAENINPVTDKCKVEEYNLNGYTAYRLTDLETGNSFGIVPSKGNQVVSIVIDGKEMLYFDKPGESGGVLMMAPYIDIVEGSKFTRPDGVEVDLSAEELAGEYTKVNSEGNVYHGMTRFTEWKTQKVGFDSNGLSIKSRIKYKDHGPIQEAFKDGEVSVTYYLKGDGIRTEVNSKVAKGTVSSFGVHPWNRREADDEWFVYVPAKSIVETEKDSMKPKDQAPVPVESKPEYDFRNFTPLHSIAKGGQAIFTDLEADENGIATCYLYNKKDGRLIEIKQNVNETPFVVYWVPKGKSYFALESLTSLPDALNYQQYTECDTKPVMAGRHTYNVTYTQQTKVDRDSKPLSLTALIQEIETNIQIPEAIEVKDIIRNLAEKKHDATEWSAYQSATINAIERYVMTIWNNGWHEEARQYLSGLIRDLAIEMKNNKELRYAIYEFLHELNAWINGYEFSTDGEYLACGEGNQSARYKHPETGEKVRGASTRINLADVNSVEVPSSLVDYTIAKMLYRDAFNKMAVVAREVKEMIGPSTTPEQIAGHLRARFAEIYTQTEDKQEAVDKIELSIISLALIRDSYTYEYELIAGAFGLLSRNFEVFYRTAYATVTDSVTEGGMIERAEWIKRMVESWTASARQTIESEVKEYAAPLVSDEELKVEALKEEVKGKSFKEFLIGALPVFNVVTGSLSIVGGLIGVFVFSNPFGWIPVVLGVIPLVVGIIGLIPEKKVQAKENPYGLPANVYDLIASPKKAGPNDRIVFLDPGGVVLEASDKPAMDAYDALPPTKKGDVGRDAFAEALKAALADYETGKINDDEFYMAVCSQAGLNPENFTKDDLFDVWNSGIGEVIEGMEEEVKDLKARGLRIYWFTNTSPLHTRYLATNARFNFMFENCDGFIPSWFYQDKKPSRELFLKAMKAIGLREKDASRVIYVDDGVKYIQGANEAMPDVRTVLYQNTKQFHTDMSRFKTTPVVTIGSSADAWNVINLSAKLREEGWFTINEFEQECKAQDYEPRTTRKHLQRLVRQKFLESTTADGVEQFRVARPDVIDLEKLAQQASQYANAPRTSVEVAMGVAEDAVSDRNVDPELMRQAPRACDTPQFHIFSDSRDADMAKAYADRVFQLQQSGMSALPIMRLDNKRAEHGYFEPVEKTFNNGISFDYKGESRRVHIYTGKFDVAKPETSPTLIYLDIVYPAKLTDLEQAQLYGEAVKSVLNEICGNPEFRSELEKSLGMAIDVKTPEVVLYGKTAAYANPNMYEEEELHPFLRRSPCVSNIFNAEVETLDEMQLEFKLAYLESLKKSDVVAATSRKTAVVLKDLAYNDTRDAWWKTESIHVVDKLYQEQGARQYVTDVLEAAEEVKASESIMKGMANMGQLIDMDESQGSLLSIKKLIDVAHAAHHNQVQVVSLYDELFTPKGYKSGIGWKQRLEQWQELQAYARSKGVSLPADWSPRIPEDQWEMYTKVVLSQSPIVRLDLSGTPYNQGKKMLDNMVEQIRRINPTAEITVVPFSEQEQNYSKYCQDNRLTLVARRIIIDKTGKLDLSVLDNLDKTQYLEPYIEEGESISIPVNTRIQIIKALAKVDAKGVYLPCNLLYGKKDGTVSFLLDNNEREILKQLAGTAVSWIERKPISVATAFETGLELNDKYLDAIATIDINDTAVGNILSGASDDFSVIMNNPEIEDSPISNILQRIENADARRSFLFAAISRVMYNNYQTEHPEFHGFVDQRNDTLWGYLLLVAQLTKTEIPDELQLPETGVWAENAVNLDKLIAGGATRIDLNFKLAEMLSGTYKIAVSGSMADSVVDIMSVMLLFGDRRSNLDEATERATQELFNVFGVEQVVAAG